MKQRDTEILEKMIRYCNEINSIVNNCDYDIFAEDYKINYSCSFALLQIGELVNKLSPDVKDSNPQIMWRGVRDFRNIVAHEYENIDMSRFWNIVKEAVPELLEYITKILQDEDTKD